MTLDSAPARVRQDDVQAQHDINALADVFASAVRADSASTLLQLAFQPTARVARASNVKPKYRTSTSVKLVQLNARVSAELRDALRVTAGRRRMSIAELVTRYCEAGLRRERE